MFEKPERIFSKSDAVALAVLAALSLAYYLSYYNYSLNPVDEGINVNSALRILDGQKMYRDFDISYAPGRYYLIALGFKLFGANLLVSKLVYMAFVVMNVLLVYLIARRFMPLWLSAAPALTLLVVPGQWYKSFHSFGPLLCLLVLLVYLTRNKGIYLALLGVATSVAVIFRHDAGIYVIFAVIVVLALSAYTRNRDTCLRTFLQNAGIYAGCTFLGLLPALVYFSDSLGEVYRLTIAIPFFRGAAMQLSSMPFPDILALAGEHGALDWRVFQAGFYYLPVAVYVSAAVLLVKDIIRGADMRQSLKLVALVLIGVLLYNKPFWIRQYDHLLQAAAPFYITAAYLLYRLYVAAPRAASYAGVLAFAAFWGVFAYYNVFVLGGVENGSIAARLHMKTRLDAANAAVYTDSAPGLNMVVRTVDRLAGRDEYIYVFPQTAMLYFLTGRKNPTRQDFSLSDVYTDSAAEREILESIKRSNVGVMVYDEVDMHIGYKRPEELYYRNYAPNAYRYITDNYSEVWKVGRYRVLLRNDLTGRAEGMPAG